AEHREADEQHHGVRAREGRVPEQIAVEHRCALAHLEHDERRDRDDRRGEERQDQRIGPPVGIGLDEREREREEADARGEKPGKVESLVLGRVTRLVDDEARHDDREDPDRYVDEEDPAPADVLGDEPARERADRKGHRGASCPDADRHPALPWRERGGDDREGGGVHERGAGSLDDAGADQPAGARRETAEERRDREDHEPDDEDPPPPEHVGEFAAGQHEDAERERVAVEDPLELGDADAQVALDRRQRHVHDRVVEHDHEQAEGDRSQRPPLPVLRVEDLRLHPCLLEKLVRTKLAAAAGLVHWARMADVVWRPDARTLEHANVSRLMRRHGYEDYWELARRSQEDPEWFWPAAIEDMGLDFATPWEQVMDLSRGPEWATWFLGSTLSIAWNCVHRWAERDPGRVAAVGLGEDGARWEYTFAELSSQVTRLAEGLASLGVEPGDRVAIYMPMCPEVAVASHACAHLGAVQVPIFSGFAGPAVRERLQDSEAKVVVTADWSLRRGKRLDMRATVEAARAATAVEHVVTWKRQDRSWRGGAPGSGD